MAHIQTLPADSTLSDVIEALEDLPEGHAEPAEARLPAAVRSIDEMFLLLRTAAESQREHIYSGPTNASGLRLTELLDMRVADMLGHILVVRSGKTDKDRYAQVDPYTAELLRV